jgi:uncharacterized tellurite resistance protein B-like protein
MFGRFLQALLAPAPAPLSADEAHLALAALLVRVARADGTYGAAEMRRIDLVLCADFRLSPFEAAALRAQAEVLEAEAPDTVRFTRALKDAVALDERGRLVEALWSVAGEDGALSAEEDSQIRLIASLLGVNDRDRALARQRAERN